MTQGKMVAALSRGDRTAFDSLARRPGNQTYLVERTRQGNVTATSLADMATKGSTQAQEILHKAGIELPAVAK